MVLGAIVVVGAEGKSNSDEPSLRSNASGWPRSELLFTDPLMCADILGRSAIEHIVAKFVSSTVEVVTVLAQAGVCPELSPFRRGLESVTVQVTDDLETGIARIMKQYEEQGVDYTFITDSNTYTDCDFIDLLWFHRGSRRAITHTFDRGGALNLAIASCTKAHDHAIFLTPSTQTGSDCYFISDYVQRLAHPKNMRALVEDALRGRCDIRPLGQEIRPGVWVDDGAQLHKRARIVAPAYIGKGSVVREDTVVTRCSNIERLCYIDYGTVIEDSSILTNSYVGIWLDVTHAVVRGNNLWNLSRDMGLEISDPSVVRQNIAVKQPAGAFSHLYESSMANSRGATSLH